MPADTCPCWKVRPLCSDSLLPSPLYRLVPHESSRLCCDHLDLLVTRRYSVYPSSSDVELQYHNKLGFESKIESLREVNKLNQEQARLRGELLLSPLIGPKLVKLTQSGVTEQDIINIAAVFEKYIPDKDRRSFVSELEQYEGLKSAIRELSNQSERMRTEVSSLASPPETLKMLPYPPALK